MNTEKKYPYIGKFDNVDLVVLFTSEKTGRILTRDSSVFREGGEDDSWVEEEAVSTETNKPEIQDENSAGLLSEETKILCDKYKLTLSYYKGSYLVYCEDSEAEYKIKTVEEFYSLVAAMETLNNFVVD